MSQKNPAQLATRNPAALVEIESASAGRGGFDGDGVPSNAASADWARVRSALWRFKWLLAILPILAGAGGYAVSRYIMPEYTARATVWINKQADASAARGGQSQQFGSDAWTDLFRSYTVIDRVVNEKKLMLSLSPFDSSMVASFAGLQERFTPGNFTLTVDGDGKNYSLATPKGVVLEHRPVGGPIGESLGFKWTPPATALLAGMVFNINILSPRAAAIGLLGRLKVSIDLTGTFLHAELKGTAPSTLATTLNSIIQQFVEVATRMKSEGLADRTRILGDQLKTAQRDLASAETALEQFRLQSITRPGARIGAAKGGQDATPDPGATSYFQLQASMDAALRERTTIRRVLSEAADSGIAISELERLPSVIASSELSGALRDLSAKRAALRVLTQKYTDSHSAVIKARADLSTLERVVIPEMANRVVASLSLREAELAASASAAEKDLRNLPALSFTEARLQRAVTLAEALYSQLQPQFAAAQLAEGSAVPDVRPLDAAEAPQFADQLVTKRLVLVALLGGLAIACGTALLLDRNDPKFRYPNQVTDELGLVILGAVPHVSAKAKAGTDDEGSAAFQEAIRDIRMNVEYAYGAAWPVILTISSAGPTDGKSFISSNLARSFSENGRRTLLIDGDLRRGELHRRCGVQRRPGLTDCLRGDVPLDRVIQRTKFSRLDLISSGTRKHDAPELLGSSETAAIFGEIRTRYDVIICDSPPLSAGIDPFLLAALAGSLLLVVRTGVSVREVIESKLDVLGRMPVRVLGAVLNDVPRNSVYGYYSSYLPGYDTTDETGTALQRIIF